MTITASPSSSYSSHTDGPYDGCKYSEVTTNSNGNHRDHGDGSPTCYKMDVAHDDTTDTVAGRASDHDNANVSENMVMLDGENGRTGLKGEAEGRDDGGCGDGKNGDSVYEKLDPDRETLDPDPETLRWGWGRWNPKCLRRFNSAPWLLATMCTVVFFQGMLSSGLMGSSATSIERRFQLRSQEYGVLVSIYEATHIIFILFVAFIGGRGHKPKWVSVGCLIMGLGSLLFALPHFTTDTYENFHDGDGDPGICEKGRDEVIDEQCSEGQTGDDLSRYIYVFGGAQVLLALGSLPVYTLGIAIIDESVTVKNNGVYLGLFFAMGTIGPAIGYVVAGLCLTIFTDIHLPEGAELSDKDPGWVGAWWIGYVMAGFCILLIAIPLGAFPRELPTTAKIRSEKECQAHANAGAEITAHPSFGSRPGDLLKAIKYLLINPTFMCTTLAGCSDTLMITAFGVFLPKFIENQFATTATVATTIVGEVFDVLVSRVSIFLKKLFLFVLFVYCLATDIVSGTCIVPGGVCGVFFGGWVIRRFRLRVIGTLKFCLLMTIITTITIAAMFLRCPQNDLAGVLVSYEQDYEIYSEPNLTHSCNAECFCSTSQYIPVCLEGRGIEFFSPCHAGCTHDHENGTYSNCACVGYMTGGANSTVTTGKCSSDCFMLPVFVALLIVLLVVMFMPMVPATNVTLRCVPESQRPMALGVQSVIGRSLGSIPGPILFGIIIDSTCLQWQEACNNQGSCWLYRNESFALRLVILSFVLKITCGFLYLMAWRSYKLPTSPSKTKHEPAC